MRWEYFLSGDFSEVEKFHSIKNDVNLKENIHLTT